MMTIKGQIYTNAKAGIKYKSAAQGLITFATYGLGMLIGLKLPDSLLMLINFQKHHFTGR